MIVIIRRVAAYNSYSRDGSFYGLQSCDFQSTKEEEGLTITVRAGSRLPKSYKILITAEISTIAKK